MNITHLQRNQLINHEKIEKNFLNLKIFLNF